MSLTRTAVTLLLMAGSAVGQNGVLSHIAAGGGWTTTITIINRSPTGLPMGFAVHFHNEDGSVLSLPVTTLLRGQSRTTTTASVNVDLAVNETAVISVGDEVVATVVGWADVSNGRDVGGFAIFRYTPQTGPASEGTVPLQTEFLSTLTLPYDDTAGSVMGVALASTSMASTTITAIIFDDLGKLLGTQNLRIAGGGHTSFVLPVLIPLTAGRRGIVQFQPVSGMIAGIGLRFSPVGTFTSVPTI